MGKPEKIAILNCFIYANFNYCSLVWYFSTCESIRKIEKIQKRCLRIVINDYESDYDILLKTLRKSNYGNKVIKVLSGH